MKSQLLNRYILCSSSLRYCVILSLGVVHQGFPSSVGTTAQFAYIITAFLFFFRSLLHLFFPWVLFSGLPLLLVFCFLWCPILIDFPSIVTTLIDNGYKIFDSNDRHLLIDDSRCNDSWYNQSENQKIFLPPVLVNESWKD